jgi:hypothetical protein
LPPTVKVIEVVPDGIVTLGGIVRSAGCALSVMVAPELGALPVSVTEQFVVAGGVIVTWVQDSEFNAGGVIVTVPPVVVTGSDEPVASEASLVVIWSDDDESFVEPDTTNATVAMAPPPTVVAPGPDRTHIAEPATVLLQLSVLFAAVPAAPVENVADEKSAVE